jgi:hypothetical protein
MQANKIRSLRRLWYVNEIAVTLLCGAAFQFARFDRG